MPLTLLLPCAWTNVSISEADFLAAQNAGNARAFSNAGVSHFRGGLVSMRPKWIRKVLVGLALSAVLGAHASAQQSGSEEGKRKVKTKVAPVYPELAKRMSVSGKVKIEVIITPDGRVKSTRALGGHPLLVQSCIDAVKEWKFASAPEETTQVVEFEFSVAS
jgi:TonB family protein